MFNKIKKREEIEKISEELKKEGKLIVTVNGCFDLFHAGHLDLLEESSKVGDILIVGINSDNSIKKYKGWKRPIIPEQQRAEIISGIGFVDYVTIFDEIDCLKFIESVKSNIHVKGQDYNQDCIESSIVEKYGGRIHITDFKTKISTSDIIQRVIEKYGS